MAMSLRKLAELAGVSDVTVLRALRGEKNVRPQLRKQIVQLAQKYRYEPNLLTRGVFGKKTQTIGIIVPDSSALHYSASINAAIDVLQGKGYRALILTTGGDLETEYYEILQASGRRVDGILMIASSESAHAGHFDEIEKRNIPLVLMSRPMQRVPFDIFTGADRKDGYLLTKRLMELGHRKILHITHLVSGQVAEMRRTDGWKEALSQEGIDPNPFLLNLTDDNENEVVDVIAGRLKSRARPTAVFAGSIGSVPAIFSAAKKVGLGIAKDLSIAAFLYGNPNDMSRKLPPRVSGIVGPSLDIGKRAAQRLIELIEGKTRGNGKKSVKGKLFEIPGQWFEGDTIAHITDD